MIRQYLRKRRATNDLAAAMRRGDLAQMQQAIEDGADLGAVKDSFDEPMQHFQMSYDIKGALPLAIELDLPMEAFRLLMDAGANPPIGKDGRTDIEALFPQSQPSDARKQHLLDMIEACMQQRDISQRTPVVSTRGTARRNSL